MFRSNRRKTTQLQQRPLTEQSLRTWLVDYLADKLKMPPEEVDTAKRFEDYAVDSRTGLQLMGKLEKLTERRLSPALLFEHDTIEGLVLHLMEEPS